MKRRQGSTALGERYGVQKASRLGGGKTIQAFDSGFGAEYSVDT